MHQGAQNVLHQHNPHSGPGADPSPSAKGYELEVIPTWLDPCVLPTQEPLWPKLQGAVPHLGVSPYGPDVDAQASVLGDVKAVNLAWLVGDSREVQRG